MTVHKKSAGLGFRRVLAEQMHQLDHQDSRGRVPTFTDRPFLVKLTLDSLTSGSRCFPPSVGSVTP